MSFQWAWIVVASVTKRTASPAEWWLSPQTAERTFSSARAGSRSKGAAVSVHPCPSTPSARTSYQGDAVCDAGLVGGDRLGGQCRCCGEQGEQKQRTGLGGDHRRTPAEGCLMVAHFVAATLRGDHGGETVAGTPVRGVCEEECCLCSTWRARRHDSGNRCGTGSRHNVNGCGRMSDSVPGRRDFLQNIFGRALVFQVEAFPPALPT